MPRDPSRQVSQLLRERLPAHGLEDGHLLVGNLREQRRGN
jgi:hypothetical protein